MHYKIKIALLAALLALSASTALAQTADFYRYEYDANGNRIKRELIARPKWWHCDACGGVDSKLR